MATKANWNYPTAIRFGAGRIKELPEALKAAGISRPLLVTDAGLVNLPVTQNTLKLLRDAGIEVGVFADVKPNPIAANVNAGIEVLRKGGHDGVIAFGGGSGLDTGKVIAFMAGQTRPMWDFEDIGDWWTRADPKGIFPIVAVPTTAGTGSEVGRAGVITDETTHTKKVIFHPLMMPKVVIADPELTVGMPAFITIGTGFDALAHCLEAYCSPGYHPLADGIAVEGVRLVLENLPKVAANPNDIEARGHMMSAAAMGAAAFQKGLGAIHALSHPVGSLHDTHHGMTNAVFMPYVLVVNRDAVEAKIARLAAYCGLPASFDAFLRAINSLREKLNVPHTLKDFKVTGEKRELIGDMAIVDPTAGGNPVELTKARVLEIFDRAMEGRLKRDTSMRGALLFDIDGTMADTDAVHLEAFNVVLGRHGHSFDRVRYTADLQGHSNLSISARFLPGLAADAQAAVMEEKEAAFRGLIRDLIRPMAGLMELLDRADASGVPVVAVTNAPRANAEMLLGGIGITDRFVALVIGEELPHGKPHPLPYLEGLRLAGADAAKSVAFEDSRSGIQSAIAAGIATIGIRSSLTDAQMLDAGAAMSAENFADTALLRFVEERLPELR